MPQDTLGLPLPKPPDATVPDAKLTLEVSWLSSKDAILVLGALAMKSRAMATELEVKTRLEPSLLHERITF